MLLKSKALGAALCVLMLSLMSPAYADTPDEHPAGDALAGQSLAKNLCSACHALEADKLSPNEAAPNFNALTLTYPPEHLAEGFAEGIVVGTDAHIGMPQFELAPDQIENLIAYLETVLPPYVKPDEGADD
jgi:mono/diheme cytochrome c family protein